MGVSARYMIAAAVLALSAGTAHASCFGCVPGGSPRPPGPPTPPPITQPPIGQPPTVQPPIGQPPGGGNGGGCGVTRPGCGGGGVKIVVPPVIIPPPSVVVNYGAPNIGLHVNQTLNVVGGGGGGFVVRGGGGFVGDVDAGVSGGMLSVAASRTETITREITAARAIQAICIDDRGDPHAASQTFGERDVSTAYKGELYRCMAGTKMRVAVGKFEGGEAKFDGARTFDCAKGEALAYDGQDVTCRTQEAKRPCNERSLLRRFGSGIKVLTLRETETKVVERATLDEQMMATSFDGGVGQSGW